MDLCDLLAPDGIIAPLSVTSKKHALQELATVAAQRTGLDPEKSSTRCCSGSVSARRVSGAALPCRT